MWGWPGPYYSVPLENSRPVSPYYADMSLEMSDQFNACLRGETSPEQTVKNLDAALQEIVDAG